MPSWTHRSLRLHQFPRLDYIVEPFLSAGNTTLLYADREAGKTQLIFTMAAAIDQGKALFDKYPTKPAKILLIEADMPEYDLKIRLDLMAQAYEISDKTLRILTLDRTAIITHPAFMANNGLKEVKEWEPDVVVWDSLRNFTVMDENDSATVTTVLDKTRALFKYPDKQVAHIYIHHTGKGSMTSEGVMYREDENNFRGSGAWQDNSDTGIILKKKKNSDVRIFRVPRGRSMTDAEKVEETALTMDQNNLYLVHAQIKARDLLAHQPMMNHKDSMDWLKRNVVQSEVPTDRTLDRWLNSIWGDQWKKLPK